MSVPGNDITEIKIENSPPMTGLSGVGTGLRMKRTPSLSKVSAWTEEDVKEAEKGNRSPLLAEEREKYRYSLWDYTFWEMGILCIKKYERKTLQLLGKLLFHVSLLSVFETIFFFLYVSSLEDNGIESTLGTFVGDATRACQNMTQLDIQLVNDFLMPLVNRTNVEEQGNVSQRIRMEFNERIWNQSWIYTGVLLGMCVLLWLYGRFRMVEIKWSRIVVENSVMVGMLAVYEIIFFHNIIYHYRPITSDEISRNAVETLHTGCGLFE